MPQVTNRKLVVEMSATPIGRGTVHSAMLKACETNRNRARRVNESENQRLEKALKVIEKDTNNSHRRLDREMEKAKRSLRTLEAFQHVLHQKYPAKKLISNKMPSQRPINCIQKESATLSREPGYASHEGKGLCVTPSPSSSSLVIPSTSSSLDDKYGIKSTASFKQDESSKYLCSLKTIRENQILLDEGSQLLENDIEIVNRANETNERPVRHEGRTRHETRTFPATQKQLETFIDDTRQSRSVSLNDKAVDSNRQNVEAHSENINTSSVIPHVEVVSLKGRKSSICLVPETKQNTGDLPGTHNKEALYFQTEITPSNTSTKANYEQASRQELRRKKITERQARAEWKVVTRGFDMNSTLRPDIDRQLRRMDPARQRKRFQKQLLADNCVENQRILQMTNDKFDQVIMAASEMRNCQTK